MPASNPKLLTECKRERCPFQRSYIQSRGAQTFNRSADQCCEHASDQKVKKRMKKSRHRAFADPRVHVLHPFSHRPRFNASSRSFQLLLADITVSSRWRIEIWNHVGVTQKLRLTGEYRFFTKEGARRRRGPIAFESSKPSRRRVRTPLGGGNTDRTRSRAT